MKFCSHNDLINILVEFEDEKDPSRNGWFIEKIVIIDQTIPGGGVQGFFQKKTFLRIIYNIYRSTQFLYNIHWHDAILCITNRLLASGALFRGPFNYRVTFYFRGGFTVKLRIYFLLYFRFCLFSSCRLTYAKIPNFSSIVKKISFI